MVFRSLLLVRSRYGKLNDGARFHVIAHVIRETVNSGKSMLATSMIGRDDLFNTSSHSRETGSLHNLIQKDRVLSAVCSKFQIYHLLGLGTSMNVLLVIHHSVLYCLISGC